MTNLERSSRSAHSLNLFLVLGVLLGIPSVKGNNDDGGGGPEYFAKFEYLSPVQPKFDVFSNGAGHALYKDRLFFTGEQGYDNELWVTDGTPEGTYLVKDIWQGNGVSSRPSSYTVANGLLFFRASGGGLGSEVWVTDGTAEGTKLVEDIDPDPAAGAGPEDFTAAVDGYVYFTHAAPPQRSNTNPRRGIWRTNGETTELVWVPESNPRHLVYYQGKIVDATMDNKLWGLPIDGATPTLIHHNGGGDGGTIFNLMVHDQTLFFQTSYPDRLWKYTGITDQLVELQEFDSAPRAFRSHPPSGHLLFLRFNSSTRVSSIWSTDGTAEGTRAVYSETTTMGGGYGDLTPSATSDHVFFTGQRTPPQREGAAYLPAYRILRCLGCGDDEDAPIYLDGVNPHANAGGMKSLAAYPNVLLFHAEDTSADNHRARYWISNGTNHGTRPLLDCQGQALALENPYAGDFVVEYKDMALVSGTNGTHSGLWSISLRTNCEEEAIVPSPPPTESVQQTPTTTANASSSLAPTPTPFEGPVFDGPVFAAPTSRAGRRPFSFVLLLLVVAPSLLGLA